MRQKRMVGTAHRKGQLPPGLPLEMTCPPSPSLFGIQFPGGGFFDAGRSATTAPTHPAATRSAANSQFRVFLAFWECTFVRFRWSPREGSDSNAKPSPRRGSGEPQKLIWISGRSHHMRHERTSVAVPAVGFSGEWRVVLHPAALLELPASTLVLFTRVGRCDKAMSLQVRVAGRKDERPNCVPTSIAPGEPVDVRLLADAAGLAEVPVAPPDVEAAIATLDGGDLFDGNEPAEDLSAYVHRVLEECEFGPERVKDQHRTYGYTDPDRLIGLPGMGPGSRAPWHRARRLQRP